ncbi:hypothetical protein BDQ17DRAFT_859673 [Cyathus striatus]|nr:hypothetical protein BDQ17DRAFT_859673 [Cyathus striatus]
MNLPKHSAILGTTLFILELGVAVQSLVFHTSVEIPYAQASSERASVYAHFVFSKFARCSFTSLYSSSSEGKGGCVHICTPQRQGILPNHQREAVNVSMVPNVPPTHLGKG